MTVIINSSKVEWTIINELANIHMIEYNYLIKERQSVISFSEIDNQIQIRTPKSVD